MKRELNRQVVQQQLDRNSDNGRGVTWDVVFKAVCCYMFKEVEYIKKQKGGVSLTDDWHSAINSLLVFWQSFHKYLCLIFKLCLFFYSLEYQSEYEGPQEANSGVSLQMVCPQSKST